MSATELQLHEPRREMHGETSNHYKTVLLEKRILCALRATPPEPLPLPGAQRDSHLKLTQLIRGPSPSAQTAYKRQKKHVPLAGLHLAHRERRRAPNPWAGAQDARSMLDLCKTCATMHTLRPPGHPAWAFTPARVPGGGSSKIDITSSRPLAGFTTCI